MELRPALPAVTLPASGQSYNPTAEAHAELVRLAVAEEERRVQLEAEGRDIKDRMMSARFDPREGERFVNGMPVDIPAEGEDDEDDEAEMSEGESLSWKDERKVASSKSKKEHAKKSKARQAEVRLDSPASSRAVWRPSADFESSCTCPPVAGRASGPAEAGQGARPRVWCHQPDAQDARSDDLAPS